MEVRERERGKLTCKSDRRRRRWRRGGGGGRRGRRGEGESEGEPSDFAGEVKSKGRFRRESTARFPLKEEEEGGGRGLH